MIQVDKDLNEIQHVYYYSQNKNFFDALIQKRAKSKLILKLFHSPEAELTKHEEGLKSDYSPEITQRLLTLIHSFKVELPSYGVLSIYNLIESFDEYQFISLTDRDNLRCVSKACYDQYKDLPLDRLIDALIKFKT